MIKKIEEIEKDIKNFHPKTSKELDKFKIKYLGKKKGIINFLLKNLKNFSFEKRKKFGKRINEIKKNVQNKIAIKNIQKIKKYLFDVTIPGKSIDIGGIHPISIMKNRIINILSKIGFSYVEGPEIEDDWHNFTALNIPIGHPAREMQDTFFLSKNPDFLLRTHTSSIQIRYMKNNIPPFRILSIGKVYRNETVSSRSHFMFHQAEGFYIDKNVSFCSLKEIVNYLIISIFGEKRIRFRPAYFPFTEPSAEVDLFYNNDWIEIMGCGMIDPNVLENVNIDPEIYSGFALGLGIERLSLVFYDMKDIRTYFDNDIRFLKQFKSEFY